MLGVLSICCLVLDPLPLQLSHKTHSLIMILCSLGLECHLTSSYSRLCTFLYCNNPSWPCLPPHSSPLTPCPPAVVRVGHKPRLMIDKLFPLCIPTVQSRRYCLVLVWPRSWTTCQTLSVLYIHYIDHSYMQLDILFLTFNYFVAYLFVWLDCCTSLI